MADYAAIKPVTNTGFLRGFRNVVWLENRKWWSGWNPIIRGGIWVLLIDGILTATLFLLPNLTGPDGETLIPGDPLQMGSELFVGFSILVLAVGIIILTQDAIIEEKQSGTAAWVLSKPLTHSAFILAKMTAHIGGMAILMVLLPGVVAYSLFHLYAPNVIDMVNFAALLGVVSLHTLFYLSLTLLMGVLVNHRSILLAVTLGSLLGGGLIPLEALVRVMPWQLPQIGLLILQGQSVDRLGATMIIATVIWSLIFLGIALWRFKNVEF